MAEYTVTLKDSAKFDIYAEKADGLKIAKTLAKYLLSDDYAKRLGTSHDILNTTKVEITNSSDECVWDSFR